MRGDRQISNYQIFAAGGIPIVDAGNYFTGTNIEDAMQELGASSGGTLNTIKENNVQVGGADINTLDFLGADFNLSETPDREINISIEDSGIDHDSTTNFEANEHIDHTGVTLTAGTGLTGGGTIAANRTFNVDTGIADGKIVKIDSATVADDEYARFTAAGLESRTAAEIATDMGMNPEKTYTVSPSGGDYTTIQAALTARSTGGELFIVYPGTYTDDTINFSADDQCVVGAGLTAQAVITNTAQICDYGAFTGCRMNNIRLEGTYTSAIDMMTGSGGLICRDVHLELSASGTIAGSPTVVRTTGTFKQVRGTLKYTNTAGSTGQIKQAIALGAAAKAELRRTIVDIDGSDASAAITLGYGTGTGEINAYNCKIDVDDTDATIVNGLAYVTGSGTNECMGNDVHVTCGGNGKTAYGFLCTSVTSLAIRCMFNHIHVKDGGGTGKSYSFSAGANCTITSQFGDIIAKDGTTGAGTVNMVSSQTDGDLSLSSELFTDAIKEYTSAAGVTIDGALIKDGSLGATGTRITKGWLTDLEVTNDITINGTALAAIYQPLDGALTSISGLTYVSASFIKLTANDTYAVRTLTETKTDLSLNNVENTALSTWAGSGNITTVGTLASGDADAVVSDASTTTKGKVELATTAETTTGTDATRAVTPDGLKDGYQGSANITTVGTIASGTWSATTVAVNKGGTGQTSYTNGQLLIGNTTGNTLAKATLTGGTGISITNGASSITIDADNNGTVTSVAAGNGMDFSSITATGSVTMGTPSTLTSATNNGLTATSHTHAITTGIANTNIIKVDDTDAADNDYAKFTATGVEGREASEVRTDINVADGADVTADNAPKAHTASHAVGGADSVFPADPDADRYLMWDDDPGELVWAEGGGGASQLSDLSDVGVTTATDKNALMADGDSWESRALVEADISDLGSYLENLSEDGTPQLGGDLDLNSHAIDFPTTADVTDCLDEDDMVSDSATALATQQSIKKYVDDNIGAGDVTASANMTDHTLVRGDGGAKGIQDSGITIDDSDNVSGIGTLGCGEITVADGSSINLQEAVTFTGATTENLIEFPDALAVALAFKEGANSYLTFVSSDGSEKIELGKKLDMGDNEIEDVKSLAFNDGGATVDIVRDEDDMATDDAAALATQQSIKKYVDDNAGSGTVDTSGDPVDNDFAKFTDADTIEGRSYSETLGDLSGEATATFSFNSQDITSIGTMGLTGTRITKGWFTDITCTNAIAADITGTAADATILETSRTIAGQSFNGSANITIASTDLSDTTTVGGNVVSLVNPSAISFIKIAADNTVSTRSAADLRTDINVADGADVTGDNAPQAHKDSHDPNDGGDALDCAAAANLDGVQAGAEGSAHSFARSDHAHRIQHSIANNAIATIDDAGAADDEYVRFTASGLEGRTTADVLSDTGAITASSSDTLTNKTITAPTLSAGTASAGTAPLKFTAGTNLTTEEAGTIEFDGTNFYITI